MTDEEAAAIEAAWHKFRRVELYRGDPDGERKLTNELLNYIPALLDERAALRDELRRVIVAADATYVDVRPFAGPGHTKIVGPFAEALEHARALLAGD